MFSLFVYAFDNMWIAIAMHTAWNFSQTVIFGLPSSGVASTYSLTGINDATNGLFYDTLFGAEGSLGAVIAVASVSAVLILMAGRKNSEQETV